MRAIQISINEELPSEVVIGTAEGLKNHSAVNLDHLQTVEQASLGQFAGSLSEQQMAGVCEALAFVLPCDWTPHAPEGRDAGLAGLRDRRDHPVVLLYAAT